MISNSNEFTWTYGGLDFKLVVDDTDGYVEDVLEVYIWTGGKNGEYVRIYPNDSIEFMDTFRDFIQEAYEEHLRDLKIAYAEMRMDAQKEEGLS